MAERQAVLVQMLFKRHAVHARFAAAGEIGLVNFEDPIERAHVEHELSGFRCNRAADTATTTERSDDEPVSGCQSEYRRHLLAAGGPSHQHSGCGLARSLLHDRLRPQVANGALIESCTTDD